VHCPAALQPSADEALHAAQALPPLPHVAIDEGALQVVPEQHPVGQTQVPQTALSQT
jgi:hypothetical protein